MMGITPSQAECRCDARNSALASLTTPATRRADGRDASGLASDSSSSRERSLTGSRRSGVGSPSAPAAAPPLSRGGLERANRPGRGVGAEDLVVAGTDRPAPQQRPVRTRVPAYVELVASQIGERSIVHAQCVQDRDDVRVNHHRRERRRTRSASASASGSTMSSRRPLDAPGSYLSFLGWVARRQLASGFLPRSRPISYDRFEQWLLRS